MKSQQFSALLDYTLGVKRDYKDRFQEEIQGSIKNIDNTRTKKEERTRTRSTFSQEVPQNFWNMLRLTLLRTSQQNQPKIYVFCPCATKG